MADRLPFQELQFRFAGNIRAPEQVTPPAGIEDRRMRIYRELFFNNVQNFLDTGFPVLRRLYTQAQWDAITRDFLTQHRCTTPYFHEIAQEFLRYLEKERRPAAEDPPFLLELAHYEWTELALSVAEDPSLEGIDANGDLLAAIPVLSPLAWPLGYRFPVHRIGPAFRPQSPGEQPTHLLVYRDRNDTVRFMELNAVTTRLLALMHEDAAATGRQLLERITEELQHPQPEVVMQGGMEILEELRAAGVILGTRKESRGLA